MSCKFKGCESSNKRITRGYCPGHYKQYSLGKELKPLVGSAISLQERFWNKVNKTEYCWLWTGSKDSKNRYGQFRTNGKLYQAHRFVLELNGIEIPLEMEVDHICLIKSCVNPEHLRFATSKQNNENVIGARKDNKSSGIRNVYWDKRSNKWYVKIGHNGKTIHGGQFKDIKEAEKAAIDLRAKYFTHSQQ